MRNPPVILLTALAMAMEVECKIPLIDFHRSYTFTTSSWASKTESRMERNTA